MLDEDKAILKLKCCECDNVNCWFADNIFPYTYDGSGRGCAREVSERVKDEYIHYVREIVPMWKMSPKNLIEEEYKKILDFLEENVYNKDISCFYNHRGKVLVDKKELQKYLNKIVQEVF